MKRRLLDLLAMMFVGDGVVTMLEPQRHCRLWDAGPKSYRKVVDTFVGRPTMTRGLGFLELLAGLWLASRGEGGILSRLHRH